MWELFQKYWEVRPLVVINIKRLNKFPCIFIVVFWLVIYWAFGLDVAQVHVNGSTQWDLNLFMKVC